MLYLKQSTAVDVMIGPFVDDSDGNTAETGLTVSQADVRLSKNGGNMAQKNDSDSCTHDELGYYKCDLDATDTATLGTLDLMVHESGALPVHHQYMVVTAHVYDSMCGSDYQQVDVIQVVSTSQTATDLKDFADTGYDPTTHKIQGLVLCDTTTTNTDMVSQANITDILADTNELQGDWANGGRLDLIIDSLALEATVAALNDLDADTVWDEVMDTNAPANANSARELINLIASALFAKTTGGRTNTLVARDLGDTKDRITLTVDGDGNRLVSTSDGT